MRLQEEFLRRGRFAPRHRLRRWLLVLHCATDCPWRRRYARNCPRPLRIDSIGVRVRPRGQFAVVYHLAIVSAASLRFRRQHPRLANLVEAERARRHWRHSVVLKSAGQSPIGLLPLDKNISIIGALTWCFVSENAASSHLCTFFWYPKCTQHGWQGFEQVNYSSFLRTFLSQFFLKLLRAPKNRSSVLVASFAPNFNAVSSIVQIRSAACASR